MMPVKLAGYSKHSKDSQKIVKLAGYSKHLKDSGKNLSWIFWISKSFANWHILKRFALVNLSNIWIFCKCENYFKDSPELNLLNIGIFCKNSEVSRIFKTFEWFPKKFESNLLNVWIFCKCDTYSKDLPMQIFWISESFENVKIISKIQKVESFEYLNLLKKIVKFAGYSKRSKDSGKNLSGNLLNVRIFCKCDTYSKDSWMRIFRISESFANVKIVSKIHQSWIWKKFDLPELNLSNIWIFCKNSEVSRIFKTFERFGKKFESNLLNVRIFCKCDKYSKDSPMRIFRMSESFANVKIISKTFQRFKSHKSFEYLSYLQKIQTFKRFKSHKSFKNLSYLQKIQTFKSFDSKFFLNLSNVLNIMLTSLFLQKIQTFKRFKSGESWK